MTFIKFADKTKPQYKRSRSGLHKDCRFCGNQMEKSANCSCVTKVTIEAGSGEDMIVFIRQLFKSFNVVEVSVPELIQKSEGLVREYFKSVAFVSVRVSLDDIAGGTK